MILECKINFKKFFKIHYKNNFFFKRKSVVQHFNGQFNLSQNNRSCISPCGTFLFNSGNDTKVYCWNINTGDQIDTITLNYAKSVRDMDFHPYDNYLVFCCNDLNAPVLIYKHNPES